MHSSSVPEPNFTDDEQQQIRLAAHAALAREDCLAFNTFIDPSYKIAPHIQLLGGYLNAVERGDIRKLAITMPPRHSKSETTSGKFPAWCLGRDPDRTVMLVSHGATLAETFSIQNRDLIAYNPRWRLVFPKTTLHPNVRGRSKWALTGQRESLIAAGVGGSIIGLGAWLLLIDDPIKNYEEANSTTHQEAVYNWYTTTARTRLTPDGRIIIIMTRWAEGDLLGRVLEFDKDFVVVHLPAISYGTTEDYIRIYPDVSQRAREIEKLPQTAFPDALGRRKGEVLWPERYPLDFIEEQAVIMGHEFESQYQGNPSAPEGTKFKRNWFKPITPLILSHLTLTPLSRDRSYDLAWSEKEQADYTAGLRATLYKVELPGPDADIPDPVKNYLKAVKIPPVMLLLEDMQRWKHEWNETYEKIIEVANQDTDKYRLLVEAVAVQNQAIRSLRKDTRMWKHDVVGVQTRGDKEVRAKYGLALASKGLVFILYPNPVTPPSWEKGFLDELAAFPSGKHDDQWDTYTQLANYLQAKIDRLLNKNNLGRWVTPFMSPGYQDFGVHLPPEFREIPANRKYLRDTLGWCK